TVPRRNKMEGKLKRKSVAKRNIIIGAVALILAFASFFYYRFTNSRSFDEKEKSIAILPFEVIGNNEDNLANGLVEDILIHLSKIKEFDKVISNKSSSQYRDTKKDIKEIGEELGAVFLVTGSIQESDGKIRVSAQLVDSRNGKTIWADDYTKQNVEIFDLQTELATQIVSALKTHITPEEKIGLSKRYTDNVEAYKLYRKGRAFADARTVASFDSAYANYKRALEIDPDYALSYAGLADLYTYNQRGIPQLEAVPIGRDYAFKALGIDSNLTEALTTLGWIQGAFDYDWIKSKATLLKAIKLNPNYPLAHMYYGNVLEYTDENVQQGIQEVKKALQLDPLSVSINWVLGRNYWLAREYDSAYNQLKKTMALDSKYYLTKGTLIYVLLEQKKFTEALELSKQLDPNNPWDYPGPYLSYTYASMGDTVRAKAELMKTIRDFPNKSSYHLARCNVILKNYSIALDELEEAYRQRDIRIYNYLKLDPTLDPIRNEPRFKALLKKTNLE
ncbi:MAG: TPR end-of-group domain-containing protein, partial [Ginsengibacter sp.]